MDHEFAERFRRTIYEHYRENRREFPWRETDDPYRVLVSEFMLQQTQTERVLPAYDRFLRRFPTVACLAGAELRDVLQAWQGLGYNRRAVSLHRVALIVTDQFDGRIPDCPDTLRTLPGIGQSTAGAVTAFAFNRPAVFVETNIRRVFLHFFFPEEGSVTERSILPLVEATLDRENPRDWYYALMDYGVLLKKTKTNANRRSAHYRRQSRFEGSDRQIRGLIVRALLAQGNLTRRGLVKTLHKDPKRVTAIIAMLRQEGIVTETGNLLSISQRPGNAATTKARRRQPK
ncbi:MAG: A/G-specific adenine glycosylase [Thermodesulfobacteriota bacterium]